MPPPPPPPPLRCSTRPPRFLPTAIRPSATARRCPTGETRSPSPNCGRVLCLLHPPTCAALSVARLLRPATGGSLHLLPQCLTAGRRGQPTRRQALQGDTRRLATHLRVSTLRPGFTRRPALLRPCFRLRCRLARRSRSRCRLGLWRRLRWRGAARQGRRPGWPQMRPRTEEGTLPSEQRSPRRRPLRRSPQRRQELPCWSSQRSSLAWRSGEQAVGSTDLQLRPSRQAILWRSQQQQQRLKNGMNSSATRNRRRRRHRCANNGFQRPNDTCLWLLWRQVDAQAS